MGRISGESVHIATSHPPAKCLDPPSSSHRIAFLCSMTQSLAYSSPWDDYISLVPTFSSSSTILAHSRPCSSSSPTPHLLNPDALIGRSEPAPWQPFSNLSYSFDDLHEPSGSPLTSPEPESEPPSTPPRVKQEDTQDEFVFELPASTNTDEAAFPAFSSMTEVPLRATQATKEMRRMMGVFRLDPFTMHNAVRDPSANLTWNGEPIGPLKEDPVLYEFQLETPDRVKSEPLPVLHHISLDESERAAKRQKHSRFYPDASPSPSLYGSLGSPSSPLDHHPHTWSASSSDTPPLVYDSPDILPGHQTFDTIMTPAQASMIIGLSPRYPSSSCTLIHLITHRAPPDPPSQHGSYPIHHP